MTVRDYFKRLHGSDQVTFIKARARKDAHTPFYHPEYQTTPIWMVDEWSRDNNHPILDSIVLNDKQPSITWLSGCDWNVQIKNGTLRCLLIISPEDLALLYRGKEQRDHMVEFIEERLDA